MKLQTQPLKIWIKKEKLWRKQFILQCDGRFAGRNVTVATLFVILIVWKFDIVITLYYQVILKIQPHLNPKYLAFSLGQRRPTKYLKNACMAAYWIEYNYEWIIKWITLPWCTLHVQIYMYKFSYSILFCYVQYIFRYVSSVSYCHYRSEFPWT